MKLPLDSLDMKKVAWGSYLLVGVSSVFFLSGLIFGREPFSDQSIFRFWAMTHTLIAGVIGMKSIDEIGRMQASNLVKLTGYLYTLTGLILAIEHIESDTISIFSGAGGALLSSLVGWFFGGVIEREETPFISGENISLALATAEVLGVSRDSLVEAEKELAQLRALIAQANQLLEEVNKFISEDPSRREVEESHRDEVLQELTKINGRLS